MATDALAEAPQTERPPAGPNRAGPDAPDTTADVHRVDQAPVEEFPAAPSSPSEVVEPTPATRDGETSGDAGEQADTPPQHLMTPFADDEVGDEAGEHAPGTDETVGTEGLANGDGVATALADGAAEPESKKKWYIIKVTSGREESIKASIERRVKIENLEEFFGQVYIPVEKVVEVKKVRETKNGERITKEKRVTKSRKKFPGYLMAEVEFNDEILYLFRETSGVGDFVGAAPGKPPAPMLDIDVARMLSDGTTPDEGSGKGPKGTKIKVKLDYEKGDKVRIRDGAFANMEGEIKEISTPKDATETPKVTVVVTIFGRGVEMELDYWQVDKV